MSTRQIVKIGEYFTIMTTYDDGYTKPQYYPREWKTRKAAENQLDKLNSM